jgi:hypothetical protein
MRGPGFGFAAHVTSALGADAVQDYLFLFLNRVD